MKESGEHAERETLRQVTENCRPDFVRSLKGQESSRQSVRN